MLEHGAAGGRHGARYRVRNINNVKRWIHNIRFSHKLAAIIVAALVPICLLTVFFLRSEQSAIGSARLELAGLSAYRPLEGMLAPLADMQLWAAAQAAGDPLAREKLQAARAQVERQMAQRVATTVDYGAPQGEDARRWGEIQSSWTALADTRFSDIAEANQRYVAFRGKVHDLLDYVTSTSGLVLDPDPVNYLCDHRRHARGAALRSEHRRNAGGRGRDWRLRLRHHGADQ